MFKDKFENGFDLESLEQRKQYWQMCFERIQKRQIEHIKKIRVVFNPLQGLKFEVNLQEKITQ